MTTAVTSRQQETTGTQQERESVLVIETHTPDGVEWGVSFSDHNPEDRDYVPMKDGPTAFKLQALIRSHFTTPEG